MDWYEEYIEEGIRNEVKLLRDHGFNTESSCHHDMHIQVQVCKDDRIYALHGLLSNNGYRNYTIKVEWRVVDGYTYSYMIVTFDDKIKVERY
jgi:hypothetical protein